MSKEKKMRDVDASVPQDETIKEKKRKSKVSKIIWAIVILLVAVLIGLGVKFYIDVTNPGNLFNNDFNVQVTAPAATQEPTPTLNATLAPNETPAPTPEPTPAITPETALLQQADMEFMKNRVNLLILGVDENTDRSDWGSFRTDTMILVTVDFSTNDVMMISIPRDSYVKIVDDQGKYLTSSSGRPLLARVNTAFPKGGGEKKKGYAYTMNTVSALLGVPVNYYVSLDMNAAKDLVDAMGGIDYDVDIDVYRDGRTLKPGYQHLDGQAVLDYCRMRKGSSDIARVGRQQRMIKAILNQLKTSGQIENMPAIYKALENSIETNLTLTQIAALGLVATRMDMSQLNYQTLEGEYLDMNGASYWGLSSTKLVELIEKVFGVKMEPDFDIDVRRIKKSLAE